MWEKCKLKKDKCSEDLLSAKQEMLEETEIYQH